MGKLNKYEEECLSAYKSFNRHRNFSEEIPNTVYDIEIELPEPPQDYTKIDNWGKPKQDRKFPYHSRELIKEIDSLESSDPRKKEYLDVLWDRRKNGYWWYNGDKLEWINGHYYMTLQYWLIPIEDKDGALGNPKFVDMQRDRNLAIWHGKKDPKCAGLAYVGARRSSKTIDGIALGYWDTTEKYNALFGIQSKTETDGKGVLRKLVLSWKNLPKFLKPTDTGLSTVTTKLDFSEPQKKSSKGDTKEYKDVLNSIIQAYPATEHALDGLRTTFQFQDEYGKCFVADTEVVMYDGRLKKVQDIVVGDKVMGTDSKPKIVESLTNGVQECYKITPKKGYSWGCNKNHTLTMKLSSDISKKKGWHKDKVVNMTVSEYLNLTKYEKQHLKLYTAPVKYKSKKTVIDPYLFGLWIGDGYSDLSSFSICSTDSEVEDYLQTYASSNNLTLSNSIHKNKGTDLKIYRLLGLDKTKLRKIGLHNNKFIPDDFIYNSTKKRLEFLAGIIDTDGHLMVRNGEPKCFEVVQKRKHISEAVHAIANSLGFYSSLSKKVATMKRADGSMYRCDVYRVTIYGDLRRIPTKIERKQAKYINVDPLNNKNRSVDRKGFSVESIGEKEYYGFSISGEDKLFFLKDFTVVHNCTSSDAYQRQQISKICCVVGSRVVGFSFWATTVEEMEKNGGENAKKIWDESDPSNRNANGRTINTMYRLFFPAEYGLFEGDDDGVPFVDEWGYSNLEVASAWLEKEASAMEGDALRDFRRKFPRNIDHAFELNSDGNTYNQRKLYEQHMHNVNIPDAHQPVRGNFYWKGGMKDTEVMFTPDPDKGRWLVAWHPPEDDRNRKEIIGGHWRPTREFCKTGCDPFSHRATVDKGSLAAASTILERHYDSPKLKMGFVCHYAYRQEHPHKFAEDMIMQCVYYSSYILPEKNVYNVLDYFHKRGYDGFLMTNPLDKDRIKKRMKGERGYSTSGVDARETLMDITQAYINDYMGLDSEGGYGFCPFAEIISDWRRFEPNNWTPYDSAVAAGLALIATKKIKIEQPRKYELSDFYAKYDNRGKHSVRIK